MFTSFDITLLGERHGGFVVSGLDWKGLDLRCGLVIVLCSSAKHFHLRVPLSTQGYTCKWAQVNSGKAEEMLRGNLMMD